MKNISGTKFGSRARGAVTAKRGLCGPALLLFVCLLPASVASAFTQDAPTPPAQEGAIQTRPATAGQERDKATPPPKAPLSPSPATPRAVVVPGVRPGVAPPAQLIRPATPAQAPQPPRQVVTVVHRLSGWKLLRWLALTGPPQLEIDKFPSASDVHTNIVAGLVSIDGRTVMARLPQAEAELESMIAPPLPAGFFTESEQRQLEAPEFTLVRADGKKVDARFVGLDAATGLSLLEASEQLFPAVPLGDEGNTETPTVGQRVRLFAPARVPAPAPQPPNFYNGDMGVIFLGMGQAEGLLTEVRQTTYGKAVQATLQSKSGSPAWTGAVATNEAGALLGIVTQSGVGETHLVPIDAMRGAWERVLARGASVPQPWLGVRGDAAATVPLPLWVENGWKPETITSLMKDMQGVLLTSVAPGTPAALAGLRPGDVISRVGERDVRGVEDLSMFLKEAGVGSKLDFTVHRAMEASPLKFPVILSGTQNPALATAEAEVRAARSALYAAEAERRAMQLKEQRLRTDNHAAALAELRAHLLGIEQKLEHARSQTFQAEKRAALARLYATGAAGGSFAPLPRIELSIRPLQLVGLEVIGLTARSAPRLNAKSGVLVVSVRPGSPADTSGLRAGDVIETINNQTFTRLTLNDKLRNASAASLSVGVVREGKRIALTLGPVGAPPAP